MQLEEMPISYIISKPFSFVLNDCVTYDSSTTISVTSLTDTASIQLFKIHGSRKYALLWKFKASPINENIWFRIKGFKENDILFFVEQLSMMNLKRKEQIIFLESISQYDSLFCEIYWWQLIQRNCRKSVNSDVFESELYKDRLHDYYLGYRISHKETYSNFSKYPFYNNTMSKNHPNEHPKFTDSTDLISSDNGTIEKKILFFMVKIDSRDYDNSDSCELFKEYQEFTFEKTGDFFFSDEECYFFNYPLNYTFCLFKVSTPDCCTPYYMLRIRNPDNKYEEVWYRLGGFRDNDIVVLFEGLLDNWAKNRKDLIQLTKLWSQRHPLFQELDWECLIVGYLKREPVCDCFLSNYYMKKSASLEKRRSKDKNKYNCSTLSKLPLTYSTYRRLGK